MVDTVGIIGAGQMGSGIAHICAVAGMNVVLSDISMDQVNVGLAVIRKNMERQVGKGVLTAAEIDTALGRIEPADNLAAHKTCDLVISRDRK